MSPFWFLCVFVFFFCDRQLVIVHSCLVVPPHPCCSLLAHIELIEEETKLILIKHESSFSFAEFLLSLYLELQKRRLAGAHAVGNAESLHYRCVGFFWGFFFSQLLNFTVKLLDLCAALVASNEGDLVALESHPEEQKILVFFCLFPKYKWKCQRKEHLLLSIDI